MQIPKEFFTLESMLTLTGATGATFVVANGIQRAFNFNPRWLALAIAQIVSLSGVMMSGGTGSDYFIGIVNGFLIFCTAAGSTSALGPQKARGVQRGDAIDIRAPQPKRGFLTSWF